MRLTDCTIEEGGGHRIVFTKEDGTVFEMVPQGKVSPEEAFMICEVLQIALFDYWPDGEVFDADEFLKG